MPRSRAKKLAPNVLPAPQNRSAPETHTSHRQIPTKIVPPCSSRKTVGKSRKNQAKSLNPRGTSPHGAPSASEFASPIRGGPGPSVGYTHAPDSFPVPRGSEMNPPRPHSKMSPRGLEPTPPHAKSKMTHRAVSNPRQIQNVTSRSRTHAASTPSHTRCRCTTTAHAKSAPAAFFISPAHTESHTDWSNTP